MKIYIVNLEKDIERKASIKAQLDALNLDYQFISAVYGKALSQEEIAQLSPDFEKTRLTLPELGCALSHLKVYREIIKNNDEIALILEDDVKLHHNIKKYLDLLTINNNPNTPEVIILGKVNEYIDSFKKILDKNYSLVNVIDSVGAYGYCLNKKAAENLLTFLQPIWIVSDEWKLIREKNVAKIKAIVPPLITFTDYADTSTISNTPRALLTNFDKKKRKRNFCESIKLLLWRVFIRSWVKKVRP